MSATVAKKGVFIVGAKRTPFGAFGGKLKHLSATELAVHASKAAIAASGVDASTISETIYGNVTPSSMDATYLARHVALKSGLAVKSPSLSINRLCGSGFETVCLGAEAILGGNSAVVLTGGTENMSQAPMIIDGLLSRFGTPLGKGLDAKDSLWAGLTDTHCNLPMGLTAENLSEQYNITREDCDEYGLRSQQLWAKAHAAGVFANETAPVELKIKGKEVLMTADEHPRANSELAQFQKLKSVFKKDGTVTAATASGICDGAASLVVAGEEAVAAQGLTPLARVVAWCRVGCDPSVMGIGPVEAIRGVLAASGKSLADIDLFEINEAFAAQYLACEKELGLDRDKTNLNGGAIALGHPLGASGARILSHLSHELNRTGKKYAVGSACIGGGQGIAVLLENAST